MNKNIKYEQAIAELERIAKQMEEGQPDIDTLSEQLKRAKELIGLCKEKLAKTDEEIKKILSEE
jgi:exodeoxyribonuclease VII small subunit